MGCYRKGEAENPTVYAGAVALVFGEYPDDIIRRVIDPRTGLTGRLKWLPAVSEVRDACERAMQPIRAEEFRRTRQAEHEAQRTAVRSHRPTMAELRERYPALLAGANLGKGSDCGQA